MTFRLYNTLTRTKEDFTPIDPKNVRMYVCGPTVYDFAHIGNARPVIVFDVLFRLLRHLYGAEHVKYVRNITDVDDKINARALRDFQKQIDEGSMSLNDAIGAVTEKTANQFFSDAEALGCLEPTFQPRATKHIFEMVEMINVLLQKDHAYLARGSEGREVLFSVDSMKGEYGKLSNRSLDEQRAGARIAVEAHKKNPADFVLWKESGSKEPGWQGEFQPKTNAGYEAELELSETNMRELNLNSKKVTVHGRPGWHIECSVMSKAHLGEVFDIHGGGLDLIFPHHENEIAQSRCAHGSDVMANVWMHNEFLQVEGHKMSKSLGNFVTIAELMRGWRGEPWSGAAIRFEMLGTHYQQPIDWSPDRLTVAKANVQMFAGNTQKRDFKFDSAFDKAWNHVAIPSAELISNLSDDLNTALAMNLIKQSISKISNLSDEERVALVHDVRFLGLVTLGQLPYLTGSFSLSQMAEVLVDNASINFRDWRVFKSNNDVQMSNEREKWFQSKLIQVVSPDKITFHGSDPTKGKIERLIEDRLVARHTKNWKESDRIRDELDAMGVAIKDNKDGTTTWEVKR